LKYNRLREYINIELYQHILTYDVRLESNKFIIYYSLNYRDVLILHIQIISTFIITLGI